MKKLLLLFLFFSVPLFAQRLQRYKDVVYLTMESQNPAQAHLSGNIFSDLVGKELRSQYPARVLNPLVKLEIVNKGGKDYFRFTWSCRITKTLEVNADIHIDRRGTLLSGKTKQDAIKGVEAEIKKSQKVQKMIDGFKNLYGGHVMPDNFINSSCAKNYSGQWWCVKEFFTTAKTQTVLH